MSDDRLTEIDRAAEAFAFGKQLWNVYAVLLTQELNKADPAFHYSFTSHVNIYRVRNTFWQRIVGNPETVILADIKPNEKLIKLTPNKDLPQEWYLAAFERFSADAKNHGWDVER